MLGHDDFRREFGAEFIAGGATFIENSAIRECVADWREALPADGRDWVLALRRRVRVPTRAAIAVVGRSRARSHAPDLRAHAALAARRGHAQGSAARATRTPPGSRRSSPTSRRSRPPSRRGSWSTSTCPARSSHEFAKHGVHASVRPWTPESRTQAAQAVRARILTKRIELPNDPQLVAELSRLRTKYRAGIGDGRDPEVGRLALRHRGRAHGRGRRTRSARDRS